MEADINVADADGGAADVKSCAVEPEAELDVGAKLRLELSNEISVDTVDPVIAVLNRAIEGDLIEIHLRHNGGGSVDRMIALIDALDNTKAMVEITYSRYVMSAAALIWLKYLVGPTRKVQSLLPRKPGVVMYHRPRRKKGDYLCFADEVEIVHPLKGLLVDELKIFDELFEKIYQICLNYDAKGQQRQPPSEKVVHGDDGLTYRHWLMRMKDAYYGNQDCLIPV
ncbi:hypothetical protein [Pseudomonas fulva]|uniref:hypothetical protein n=1 Tax=Pseudomonas fulva TaxID=47880 RepID=UPI000F7786D5|nr:hypothetical protein [Pseudomonas fulva]MBA1217288.1 hypothetical protein [Pseudomonas fulva]MDH0571060.1 hypothetical protein [Pseudomonas fulva]RRW54169.1 hypothetical protein EGJ51_23185 [Pseudomonas fulva]